MQFHPINMRDSIETRDRIYVKRYGFLSFAKNMSNKYGQNLLDSAKKSTANAIKRAMQKTVGTTGDLIGNKIADKITNVLKSLLRNCTQKMRMKSKQHKKDIYPQKKDNKLRTRGSAGTKLSQQVT